MFGVTVQGDDYLDQDEIQATYDVIVEEHQTHFDAFKTVMDKYKEYSKAAVGKTPGGLRMHTHLSRNMDMYICIYVYIYIHIYMYASRSVFTSTGGKKPAAASSSTLTE